MKPDTAQAQDTLNLKEKEIRLVQNGECEDKKSDVDLQKTNFTSKSLSFLSSGSIENYSLGKIIG